MPAKPPDSSIPRLAEWRLVTVPLRGVTVGGCRTAIRRCRGRWWSGSYAANAANALIVGLYVALPVTGAAFAIALGTTLVRMATRLDAAGDLPLLDQVQVAPVD